jgi:hypothetical protein
MSPRAGLDMVSKRKIASHRRESNSSHPKECLIKTSDGRLQMKRSVDLSIRGIMILKWILEKMAVTPLTELN